MPETGIDVSIEVERVIAALRTAIRLSGVSRRHIERSLHMSTGYLTRILAGQVQLRLSHVLAVCRVIGFPAGLFFASLFPTTPPETVAEARLARGLGSLHPELKQTSDPETLLQELRAFLDQLAAILESGNKP
jgi:transcriptional regulator with XRE-family HTH domain